MSFLNEYNLNWNEGKSKSNDQKIQDLNKEIYQPNYRFIISINNKFKKIFLVFIAR